MNTMMCWTICSINLLLYSMAVLTVSVPATHGQSYFLAFGEIQRNLKLTPPTTAPQLAHSQVSTNSADSKSSEETLFQFEDIYQQDENNSSEEIHDQEEIDAKAGNEIEGASAEKVHITKIISSSEEALAKERGDYNNGTVVAIKNTKTKDNALSQTAMDIITIVWYIATFLALAAFFLLMACSDRRCSEELHNNNPNNGAPGSDVPQPPPTPSPSYSQFAPPSYETVMMMQHALKASPGVYVIPLPVDDTNKDCMLDVVDGIGGGNVNSLSANANATSNAGRPIFTLYTIDEAQKPAS